MAVLMYKGVNLSGSGKAVATEFDEQDADKKVASAALINDLNKDINKCAKGEGITLGVSENGTLTITYDDGTGV